MADEAKAQTKAKSPRRPRVKAEPTDATIFETARAALATAMKEAGASDDVVSRETALLAEKCGIDYPYEVYVAPSPYGGATSFSEVDSYQKSAELDAAIAELTYQFQAIVENVLGSESIPMAQKSDLISAAAADMKRRVQNPPASAKETGEAEIAGKEEIPATSAVTRVGSTAASGTSFKAFKEGEEWHWFAVYSNTGVDKAKEWFSEAAHKEFADHVWADPANRMPELWDWHTPVGVATYQDGRKGMGRADFIDYADGLAIASGHFYPEFEFVAERLAAKKDIGVSHGYEYDSTWLKPSGEYIAYRTFEISPLPRTRAANELTLFMPELAEKENPMFSETRRPWLVENYGEAKVKAMEAALVPAAAALKAAGKEVSFKDLEDALVANAPAAAAPSVPVGNAAAAAPSAEKDGAAAWANVIIAAVKEGIAPLEARIAALEKPAQQTPEEIAMAAIKEAFGPRVTPSPGSAPSESSTNVVNGNTGVVQAAKAAAKEENAVAGVPDHLQYYFKNGAASLLGSFDGMLPDADGVAAAVAAASGQPVPA